MSRHVITLFKTQTSRATTYVSHECSEYYFYCITPSIPCGHSDGIQDMKVGDHDCGWGCPTQNICLKPDRTEADIGKSSKGQDPLIHILWDVNPPNIKCVYDIDRIDTQSQINALKRLFPNEQINHVMRAFCSQTSDSCVDMKTCSRLKSVDDSGVICREWMDSLQSDEMRDSIKREYCMRIDTPDCKCINRIKQTDFNQLTNGMDAKTLESARCWYKPCESNTNLLLDIEQKRECIANVCENIINAHAQGNIDISNNTNSLSCSFTKEQLNSKPIITKPDNYSWLIIIGIFLILYFVIK